MLYVQLLKWPFGFAGSYMFCSFKRKNRARANDHFVDKGTLDLILFTLSPTLKSRLKCIEGTYDTKQFELFPSFRVKLLSSRGGRCMKIS